MKDSFERDELRSNLEIPSVVPEFINQRIDDTLGNLDQRKKSRKLAKKTVIILVACISIISLSTLAAFGQNLPILKSLVKATGYNAEEVSKEKAKSTDVHKEMHTEVVNKFVESLGYKVRMNSLGGYWTILPKDFNEIRNGFDIGNFLKERNENSKKYGFDFSQYMGKEITYVTCGMKKEGNSAGDLIAFLYDGKIVGVWTFDSNNKDSDHILLTQNLEHI